MRTVLFPFWNPVRVLTISVFSFALFMLFYNLGGRNLADWDEGIHVMSAEKAIQKHDYFVITHQGRIADKSPFPLYPMIVSLRVFGLNETAARVSSALFGLGILVQVFLISRHFYGKRAAVFAVFILSTSTQLVFDHGLRTANIDSITLFFLTGAISCWLLVERGDYRIISTMASLGAAFLCKGPIIAIPICAILLSIPLNNSFRRSSAIPLLVGFLLVCALVLPWYFYMYKLFGYEFIRNNVLRNFLQRYAAGIEGHNQGDMYFLDILLSPKNFLWYGVAVVSLVNFFRRFSQERRLEDFVLIGWVLASFMIVNQSQTKLDWYIFPLYPPLAIMSAKTLDDFIGNEDYLNKTAYYLGLIVCVTFLFNHWLFALGRGSNLVRACLVACVIYGSSVLLVRFLPLHQRGFRLALVVLLCLLPGFYSVERALQRDTAPPVMEIVSYLEPGKPINTFQLNPSENYYLSKIGEVREFYRPEDVAKLKGQRVITRKEVIDNAGPKSPDGSFRVPVGLNSFAITPLGSENGFTVVKVD
jgi:4-amino-4-deoxy-L-arabinose transferase-like glycosyltransferase